ncbi:hypothetical protein KAJ27_23090, partial [bacterium]|nr:hypothetical protein [bacterium]
MKKSIVTIIILFILLSVLNASDYDIKNLELKISNYIKAHSGKVVMKDIRVLKHLSILSNVVIENAELLKPKENSNLFFISGRGYINTSFFDLKNKKMDMVIEISSDVSNSSSKDLKYSIGWFFKKWDFLDRKNIKLKNTMFFWSNQANSYSKDDIPEKIRDKYSDLLKSTNNVIRLRKHGNIFGILNISYYKAFKFLKSLIPTLKNNYNMMLSGYITWPAREIELRAKLPSEVDFKLPKGMRANMPTFFITLPDIRRHNPFNIGRKMMMGIELQVDAKLPPHNTPMSFIGKISIPYKPSVNRGIKTALIASDKGKAWKDACNIKGLDIYELVFECELFPEDIVFGFRGKLDIGKKKIDVAATVPLDIEDLSKISFSAKLNKLSVADLFFFMKNNHPKGKKDEVLLALDKIEYKDVQMTFSAVNDRELNLSEGIALTATLNIYGKDIKRTELRTWKLKGYKNYIVDGYTEKACIGKIKLGAFELSGKGFDKKYGTKDDGPTYEFVLALTEQNFVISGITKLFDSLINLEVYLGLTGGYAKAKAKILENLDTKLEFKYNINWKAPYVQLTGSFDTDFSSYLSKKAREMIEKAKKNMDKKLNSAKDNVAKAKKKVDKLKP